MRYLRNEKKQERDFYQKKTQLELVEHSVVPVATCARDCLVRLEILTAGYLNRRILQRLGSQPQRALAVAAVDADGYRGRNNNG